MYSCDYSPVLLQYIGPAFGPVVAELWRVIGQPLCELCLLFWGFMVTNDAQHSLAIAIGPIIACVIGWALMLLVIVAAFAVCLVGTWLIVSACLVAFLAWRRDG